MVSIISIIIPVYNGAKFIGRCLNSVYRNKINVPFEVIVVDDASTDDTARVVQRFPCSYFKIEKSGVAAARNLGIKKAKGEIIFFFDADVKLKDDTLERFLRHFQEDRDAYVIQGYWDGKSPKYTFSSRFLLLRYTYNLTRLFKGKRRLEVGNLETGCVAMRSEVFDYFKGFDERYRFSGGEEHELGIRLLDKYKVYYYTDIPVEHTFGSIFETLGKIYRRTINFAMLSFKTKDKDFMRLHRNSVPMQDKVSVAIIFLLLNSCFLFFLNVRLAFTVCVALLLLYFLNISKFLLFLITEENLFFAIVGALTDFTIMFPRLFGLSKAVYVFYILGKKEVKI